MNNKTPKPKCWNCKFAGERMNRCTAWRNDHFCQHPKHPDSDSLYDFIHPVWDTCEHHEYKTRKEPAKIDLNPQPQNYAQK